MKRKIYNRLLDWKSKWKGRTALMIDGARRIGKSWIAEEFAKNEYKSYIIIDFNNTTRDIIELFDLYLTDLNAFFMRLSLYTGIKLYDRNSVIIFDEVQLCPKARTAIKYLVKDGRYDFIETGSLVSINHNVKDILIPSEEIRIDMFPMDFEEFMWATDNKMLYDYLKQQFSVSEPVGNAIHRQAMEKFREYLLVGGMPQAVLSYIENSDILEVDSIKRSIISLYRNDISKYAGRQAPYVSRLFDNIPGLLQQHEKRFRPSKVKAGSRMRDYNDAMFWLNESRVVNFCYNATEPSVSLSLNLVDSKLKMYMADTGLLLSMAFNAKELQQEGIYERILHGKLEFNKGMIVENIVAQMLRSNGHPLFFYSSYSRTIADDRMEIDFMIRKANITSRHNISPIEVKSSPQYKLTSLEKFSRKFKEYIGQRYVLHSKDLEIRDNITFLPLYMCGML